jgi:hypothetical protein
VDGTELARAVPDPLATREAALLLHLTDTHRPALDLLTRLVPARLLQGVHAVHPRRLDRYGLVLRLEHARTEHDVRLRFPAPVNQPDEAADQLRALLFQARTRRRGNVHSPHAKGW